MRQITKIYTKLAHCLNMMLATVAAYWKLRSGAFGHTQFIKSNHFDKTLIKCGKGYFIPLDEKYYLSYMERRRYFDVTFGKCDDVDGYNIWRHYYALGAFELD